MSAADAKQRAIGEFERGYHDIEAKRLDLSAADLERPMWLRAFIGIPDDVDTVNAKQFQEWRGRSVDEAFTELDRARSEFMEALRALPAERVVKPDGQPYRYFWTPGAGHLQLHWEHIEAALKETATS